MPGRDVGSNVGRQLHELDTPALLIDTQVLATNISRTSAIAKEAGARLRPHIKTHRMLDVAHQQMAAGAQGICCAKTGEAEVFADGGIDDIFIANQVVGAPKLRRLQSLAERVRLAIGVDHPEQVESLRHAFADSRSIDISIEVDVGQARTGVSDRSSALALARQVLDASGLNLRGIYTHEGHDYNARDAADLAAIADKAQTHMLEIAEEVRSATGTSCEVSMGSTPSLLAGVFRNGIDELRPGTAVFNDGSHANFLGHTDWCAATVLATIVNQPAPNRVVIDAGAKALTSDRRGPGILENIGFGLVVGRPEATIVSLSDEHGVLNVPDADSYRIGDQLQVIPNHICPCVNLYDYAYATSNGLITDIWRVSARGQSQ
jgi:D-serine deaminase-like pyridoxal phosphate-dependent protein